LVLLRAAKSGCLLMLTNEIIFNFRTQTKIFTMRENLPTLKVDFYNWGKRETHPTLCFSLGAVWYLFLLVGSDATLGK
jgi:hypothetical protein